MNDRDSALENILRFMDDEDDLDTTVFLLFLGTPETL